MTKRRMIQPRYPTAVDLPVAEIAEWYLCRRAERDDDWVSLRLFCKVPAPKVSYWLGWSRFERRLARSKQALLLHEHHPAIYDWVIEQCEQNLA